MECIPKGTSSHGRSVWEESNPQNAGLLRRWLWLLEQQQGVITLLRGIAFCELKEAEMNLSILMLFISKFQLLHFLWSSEFVVVVVVVLAPPCTGTEVRYIQISAWFIPK